MDTMSKTKEIYEIKLGRNWTEVEIIGYFRGQVVVGWVNERDGLVNVDIRDRTELRHCVRHFNPENTQEYADFYVPFMYDK